MTDKHTPGPWITFSHDKPPVGTSHWTTRIWFIGQGKNNLLASTSETAIGGRYEKETEANASLIALAPEMAVFVKQVTLALDPPNQALLDVIITKARTLLSRINSKGGE